MVVENPNAGQGSVLLDIGGDIGALVVIMPPALVGVEVEINRIDVEPQHAHEKNAHDHAHVGGDDEHPHNHAGGGAHRPHVAVVARPTAGGVVHSLVFRAGRTRRHRSRRRSDGGRLAGLGRVC